MSGARRPRRPPVTRRGDRPPFASELWLARQPGSVPPPHPALTRLTPFLAQRVAALGKHAAARELSDHGLAWPELVILVAISAIDGMTQEAVADRTGIDRSTVSITVRALEEDGFLACRRDRFDRRRIRCSSTPEGAATVAEAARAAERAARQALGRLDASEYAQLRVLLSRAIEQPRQPGRH